MPRAIAMLMERAMSERRILVIGSNRLGLSIAALLAARNIEAVVLQSPPEPTATQKAEAMDPFAFPPPSMGSKRNKAQWKSEIHGRRKP